MGAASKLPQTKEEVLSSPLIQAMLEMMRAIEPLVSLEESSSARLVQMNKGLAKGQAILKTRPVPGVGKTLRIIRAREHTDRVHLIAGDQAPDDEYAPLPDNYEEWKGAVTEALGKNGSKMISAASLLLLAICVAYDEDIVITPDLFRLVYNGVRLKKHKDTPEDPRKAIPDHVHIFSLGLGDGDEIRAARTLRPVMYDQDTVEQLAKGATSLKEALEMLGTVNASLEKAVNSLKNNSGEESSQSLSLLVDLQTTLTALNGSTSVLSGANSDIQAATNEFTANLKPTDAEIAEMREEMS